MVETMVMMAAIPMMMRAWSGWSAAYGYDSLKCQIYTSAMRLLLQSCTGLQNGDTGPDASRMLMPKGKAI
jgi:hypothetical protein